MITMVKTATLPLSPRTRDALKKLERKGETYDQIIRRLVELAEQQGFIEKQKGILNEEGFTPLAEF